MTNYADWTDQELRDHAQGCTENSAESDAGLTDERLRQIERGLHGYCRRTPEDACDMCRDFIALIDEVRALRKRVTPPEVSDRG